MQATREALDNEHKMQLLQMQAINALWKKVCNKLLCVVNLSFAKQKQCAFNWLSKESYSCSNLKLYTTLLVYNPTATNLKTTPLSVILEIFQLQTKPGWHEVKRWSYLQNVSRG